MINAERLQDAITLLPEELLASVDALRKRKRTFWKPVAAVAASLLLVVGLYQLQPAKKSADNGSFLQDAADGEYVEGFAGNSKEHSTTTAAYSLSAKITEITEEYLVVTMPAGESAKVYLEKARGHTDFSPGMEILLFFEKEPEDHKQLYPDSISIK